MRACTSTPPSSSKPMSSPVATSNTRGEVTARHEPRTWTVKSLMAEMNEEPPKDLPTITVASGHPVVAAGEGGERQRSPRCPRRPGCRGCVPPPVSPRCTIGVPWRRAKCAEALLLAAADLRGGALADRDVVAEDHDGAPVDAGLAADLAVAGRVEAVLGPLGAREGAQLAERTGVDQLVDALPHGPLAAAVQPFDLVGAAHLGADPGGPGVEVSRQRGLARRLGRPPWSRAPLPPPSSGHAQRPSKWGGRFSRQAWWASWLSSVWPSSVKR